MESLLQKCSSIILTLIWHKCVVIYTGLFKRKLLKQVNSTIIWRMIKKKEKPYHLNIVLLLHNSPHKDHIKIFKSYVMYTLQVD